MSVLKTDTGAPGRKTQDESGLTQLRELGNLASYLWKKGCLLSALSVEQQVSVARGIGLFNKNIGACKTERLCIGPDSCPVRVRELPFQGNQAPVNGGGNYNPLKVA